MRAVAVLLLGLATPVALAEELELKGHKIGSSRAELPARGWLCKPTPTPVADEMCASWGQTIAGVPTKSFTLLYFGDRLSAIMASFPQPSFAQVHAAMIEKYGEPDQSRISSMQNRMGVSFDSRESRWKRPAGTIEAFERVSKVDESSVLIEANDYKAKVSAKKAGAASRGAADL